MKKRFRAILIIAALIIALVLAWPTSLAPEEDDLAPVENETVDPPTSTDPGELSGEQEIARASNQADPLESSPDVRCDLKQIEELQQFNRDNLRRLENSLLAPEAIAAYRGMRPLELKALFDEQEDTLAIMVYGLYFLFAAMGRNPELAVDYLYYQMPIREITPNPKGVPDDAARFAREARRAFTEAAMRGRHSAFTFIGLTHEAEGKDAVSLFWLTQDDYETLTEKQQLNVRPMTAYTHLAARIDPNLLPADSPNRAMFAENSALLGEHARILERLELQFRQKMESEGLSFPTLPEIRYPSMEQSVIEACENDGYSQWD